MIATIAQLGFRLEDGNMIALFPRDGDFNYIFYDAQLDERGTFPVSGVSVDAAKKLPKAYAFEHGLLSAVVPVQAEWELPADVLICYRLRLPDDEKED